MFDISAIAIVIRWAAIAVAPWRATIEVPNVHVGRTTRVLQRRNPPMKYRYLKHYEGRKSLICSSTEKGESNIELKKTIEINCSIICFLQA